jgi:hypothetical protein
VNDYLLANPLNYCYVERAGIATWSRSNGLWRRAAFARDYFSAKAVKIVRMINHDEKYFEVMYNFIETTVAIDSALIRMKVLQETSKRFLTMQ